MLNTLEILSLITGVGYAVLAARRNRLCWIAGAVSSACAAVAYGARGLPMQSGLQVFFVGMALDVPLWRGPDLGPGSSRE